MEKYFYVYYSYEPWGRGYIGKRECCCLPEDDVKYFGSFFDKTFKPTQKIILEIFDNCENCLEAEILLHDFYQVDINPHFANKSKQKSKHFVCHMYDEHNPSKRIEVKEKIRQKAKNRKPSQETRDKMSKSHMGRISPKGMLGKRHTEDTKNKQKKAAVKRNNKTHQLKDPNGIIHTFNNIRGFSDENNLNESGVNMVLKGKRNHHKGWTRA
jgi:hypothetical protein